jgi:hypothetical protein
MSRQDLVKDIMRLKLRIGEEVIGMLPENIQGQVMERRREILQAVQEALGEFLWEEEEKKQDKSGLKPVPVE